MHDPLVVAHDVVLPIPKRSKWRDKHYRGRRWGWTRRRHTNAENLGEPVWPWWRPKGWTFAVAGRVFVLRKIATIWHVEPGGRDSGEVCKHYHRWQEDDGTWRHRYVKGWKWHVHHWRVQVHFLQSWRARLFDRCELCGRKGRPNVSHQWDGHTLGWWKFQSRRGLYHGECSALVSARRTIEQDETLVRHLVAALRVDLDLSEAELLERLTDPKCRALKFHEASRLTRMLGYERDDDYRLVPKQAVS